ncbi:hypothetical protein DWUX_1028 [Desulfovibrio diazotrophicus]|nr:hypothetical protein DWUX_1028 [Desulfovibrio diazotrophicus]
MGAAPGRPDQEKVPRPAAQPSCRKGPALRPCHTGRGAPVSVAAAIFALFFLGSKISFGVRESCASAFL